LREANLKKSEEMGNEGEKMEEDDDEAVSDDGSSSMILD